MVFADGAGWNYGRGEIRLIAVNTPYLRAMPITSACEIDSCRGTLFERLGGFDMRYAPAHYEDTDLPFVVRRRLVCARFAPGLRPVAHEGGTAGTDPASGPKGGVARNQAVFGRDMGRRLAAAVAGRHPADPRQPASRPATGPW